MIIGARSLPPLTHTNITFLLPPVPRAHMLHILSSAPVVGSSVTWGMLTENYENLWIFSCKSVNQAESVCGQMLQIAYLIFYWNIIS